MDPEKLLSSFEKLFYNMAVLIVFIPITMVNLFKNFKFPSHSIEEEFAKKPDERFKKNVSPVLLLVVVFVLPTLLFQDLLMSKKPDLDFSMGMDYVGRALFIAIFVNLFPLLSAVYVLVVQKKTITTDHLARPYYAFMYSFSYPLLWLGIYLFVVSLLLPNVDKVFLSENAWWIDGFFTIVRYLTFPLALLSVYYTFKHTGFFSTQRAILATIVIIGLMLVVSLVFGSPLE